MPLRRKQHIVGASKPMSRRTQRASRAYKTSRREPAPSVEPATAPAEAEDPHPVPNEVTKYRVHERITIPQLIRIRVVRRAKGNALAPRKPQHTAWSCCSGDRPSSSAANIYPDPHFALLPAHMRLGAEVERLDAQREVPENSAEARSAKGEEGQKPLVKFGHFCAAWNALGASITSSTHGRYGVHIIPLLGWMYGDFGIAETCPTPLRHHKYDWRAPHNQQVYDKTYLTRRAYWY
ncbi:hypothetical protein B0H13DRAFT_1850847 [Mycena leptocephala]|nr:hypothetical protein B0H13DRAFT_1850847 [Mycena leptocephala]